MKSYFSNYADLKLNIPKCEIADIGALKGVHVAVSGLKSFDLTSHTGMEKTFVK